ncbi:DUF1361 domain-containing protein [Spirosoma jeollabukense]
MSQALPSYHSRLPITHNSQSGKGLRALTLLTLTGLTLVTARGLLTGNWWFFITLNWNLALAWFPLGVVLVLHDLRTSTAERPAFGSKWLLVSALLVWLAFLPNAPYIITDLYHIKNIEPSLLWFDTMAIFLYALTGLLTGLYSALIAHRMLRPLVGDWRTWVLMLSSQILSGFGIYLGRVGRWNSWDVLTNPSSLTLAVARAYQDHLSVKLTLAYGFVLVVMYVAFYWYVEHESETSR